MTESVRDGIRRAYRCDERECLQPLVEAARLNEPAAETVRELALRIAREARQRSLEQGGFGALLQEYDLSSDEGVLLMCLAEALLRIPDSATADRLIHDKLARGEWDQHLGHSHSLLVNASTWGLLLTGRVLDLGMPSPGDALARLRKLVARAGETAVRVGLQQGMSLLAGQFVLGSDLGEALRKYTHQAGLRYSYDCLGEGARTAADAARYLEAYRLAIVTLAEHVADDDVLAAPGISVKLSALHPRYEFSQSARIGSELIPAVRALVMTARDAGVGLTIDAEEADRLELSLDLFEQIFVDPALAGWNGFGLAVQTYQKRARAVVGWLRQLANRHRRRIPVRITKGAYWDSEIKHAQERGLDNYPVFTRKVATDVAYLACVRDVLAARDSLYGQFATHNAYTVAYVLQAAGMRRDFEFQRLHGMGEAMYSALNDALERQVACRIYAPIGHYDELLPYLVRRLLENGSNTSFVNQLGDETLSLDELVADPVAQLLEVDCTPHPRIPLPADLYGERRANSAGVDLSDPLAWQRLEKALAQAAAGHWWAAPLIGGREGAGVKRAICDPADPSRQVGSVLEADPASMDAAIEHAAAHAASWDATPAHERAACLRRAADLFEEHRAELMALCVREGGRCVPDAMNEVREAVDFCRYYAQQAAQEFAVPRALPGPVGEDNRLALRGRGVFLCISPWNFPVAIFTGQVAAALAAGNAVIAKPARQTPLVAAQVVQLLHRAGVPRDVLHLLPGSGAAIGERLLPDARIAGVAFTGSTQTASSIQSRLAERRGPIVPLIAETGGQNVMIVDSSALPEQVVTDVMTSAFNSAGQRCSALRVLFLQEDIADRVLEMLAGAMDELVIGDPMQLASDVGPVIDAAACAMLEAHVQRMRQEARVIKELAVPDACGEGSFFAPRVFELERIDQLEGEVFGPILHVIRYPADGLDAVIDATNSTGYGLTLGMHSRIESSWDRVCQRARVGNLYINRNMIGAVVGVQPFGGEGLSGTGPKAGGPYYLHRFATERTITINTAAVGGNPELFSL
jgi:RHH-type proline utilization regulon transcriptional repressor/proline dehydrogenase/delta 1-pyrroline-5-carboxylate dehydrogenase